MKVVVTEQARSSLLEARYVSSVNSISGWGDEDFKSMSVEQAMAGLGDEPDLYSDADLNEHWLDCGGSTRCKTT